MDPQGGRSIGQAQLQGVASIGIIISFMSEKVLILLIKQSHRTWLDRDLTTAQIFRVDT